MAANYPPHYRSQFGDTTLTKVFVGGLAWETPTEEMRKYFDQFGDILEAVIISDKNTGKSKGYGFVTFRDPESARRACMEANPVIDGRRANCNIASMGRPRPSPPRGRNQGGSLQYQGGAPGPAGSSYSGVPAPQLAPPPPPPVMYPPYGYTTYTPDYGYPQALYNPLQQPHYYQQLYGATSATSANLANPYYYGAAAAAPVGYSLPGPGGPSPRGAYPAHPAHRMQGSSYIYYHPPPATMGTDASFSPYPSPPILQQPPFRRPFSSPTDSVQITPQPTTPSETETTTTGVATSEGQTS